MSNVALGSRKKTHFEAASSKPLLASFEAFGGFEGFEGLKGRPRCLTSLLDPVQKTKTHFDEGFEGLARFDGQALMSHVAFGSHTKTF